MIRAIAAALLVTALAACAPAAGTSPGSPLTARSGETVVLEQGSSVYLALEYGFDDFELEPAALSGNLWVPEGVNQESASVQGRFALQDVRVPAGWSMELTRMRAVRTTETRFGRETGEVTYRLRAVVQLQAPERATLGVSEVSAQLVARGGDRQAISIPVRVRAPAVN